MGSKFGSVMIAAGFFTLSITGVAFAQATSGVLTGTIYDQAGARLDRAVVTVKCADTGVEHSAHPDARGDYRFENLPLGKYSVRASAIGLTAVQINDVVVEPNKASAVNVTLPIADATPISVVEVSETARPIDMTPAAAVAAPPPPPPVAPVPLPVMAAPPRDNAKAINNEIGGLRDRLALSAAQLIKVRVILEDRDGQIDGARDDDSLPMRIRREKIKSLREEAEARFRAVLNENQTDEYEEILRERRERALQRQAALQAASQ